MQNTSQKNIDSVKPVLWLALFMSNFMFIGLSYSSFSETKIVSDELRFQNTILFAIGIIVLIISFIAPKILEKNNSKANDISPFIIGLALNEATSIFAMLIGFIYRDQTLSLALFGISLIGFLLKFPRAKAVQVEPAKENQLNID